MIDYLERSKQLLGEEKISSFKNKVVLVIGIGGVGGTALEALARTGIKKFILVDCDNVDITNLNRQVLYTKNDVGKSKVDVAKNYILDISDTIEVQTYKARIGEISLDSILNQKVDFIVDAIDSVEGKLHIYEYALKHDIPLISSLGMGNRIDPELVTITKLSKTENDPLARKIRTEARKRGLDLSKISVVFSKENPILKSKTPYSVMMVPSTAGLLIAKYVLTTIK